MFCVNQLGRNFNEVKSWENSLTEDFKFLKSSWRNFFSTFLKQKIPAGDLFGNKTWQLKQNKEEEEEELNAELKIILTSCDIAEWKEKLCRAIASSCQFSSSCRCWRKEMKEAKARSKALHPHRIRIEWLLLDQ